MFGAYELFKLLGRGGNGSAFLATHIESKVCVVIKCLHENLGQSEVFVRRFRHEAELAVKVDSPHIAACYDVGTHNGTPYIVFEYIPGLSLAECIAKYSGQGRPLSLETVLGLSMNLLDGLDDLHAATEPTTGEALGIIHRDVTPRNLMIQAPGRLRIIDLGLGKSNFQDWKTRTGAIMGSPGYMAPEQVLAERTDARTDLYSAAVVIFEMFVLEPFVPAGPTIEMLKASMAPVFRPPSEVRPDLPPALDPVFAKALSPNQANRYESAKAFAAALLEASKRDRSQLVVDLSTLFSPKQVEALERTRVQVEARDVVDEVPSLTSTVVFASRPITGRTANAAPKASTPLQTSTIAAVGAFLIAIVLVTALLTSVFLETAPAEAPVVTSVEVNRPLPRVVPNAEPRLTPRATKATASNPAPRAPVQTPPRPRPPPPTLAESPSPAPAQPDRLSVERLTTRALDIRRRRPDRAQEIDAILGDISIWARTSQSARAQVALKRLQGRLIDLERR